jgi:hypothetical protein
MLRSLVYRATRDARRATRDQGSISVVLGGRLRVADECDPH